MQIYYFPRVCPYGTGINLRCDDIYIKWKGQYPASAANII